LRQLVGWRIAIVDVVASLGLRIESKLSAQVSIDSALDFLDLPLHQVQSEHALFKSIGQKTKERRFIPVLEQVKGRHDRVGLLAGTHIVDERVDRKGSKPRERGDSLGEKPREEKREIPHVFANFSLSIEGRRFEKRVRFHEHFGDFLDPAASRVSDAIHVVDVREVGQEAGDVLRNIRIMQLNAAEEMPSHQLTE
jgi:hypothetical protein